MCNRVVLRLIISPYHKRKRDPIGRWALVLEASALNIATALYFGVLISEVSRMILEIASFIRRFIKTAELSTSVRDVGSSFVNDTAQTAASVGLLPSIAIEGSIRNER